MTVDSPLVSTSKRGVDSFIWPEMFHFPLTAILFCALGALAEKGAAQSRTPIPESESVVVRIVIGTDGVPFNPVIVKGLTPEKDQSSIEAIRKWRFRPAMKDGKAVPIVPTITINSGPGRDPTAPQVQQQTTWRLSNGDEDRALLEWYLSRAEAGDTDSQLEMSKRLAWKGATEATADRFSAGAF